MAFEKIVILDRPAVNVTVEVNQTDLIGLHSLQNWLRGFRRKDSEDIPGEFELVMFYRKIVAGIASRKEEEKCSGSPSDSSQPSPQPS